MIYVGEVYKEKHYEDANEVKILKIDRWDYVVYYVLGDDRRSVYETRLSEFNDDYEIKIPTRKIRKSPI
jgi:hypothetical protein